MIVVPNIQLARSDDAAGIAEMSRQYVELGLGWSWTAPRVLCAIRNDATNVAVAHEHQRLIGFGIMQYGDTSAHLALLAVSPDRRRIGIGRHLLAWLEKCADTAGIEQIQLEVRADNPEAMGFYESQGFKLSARVAGYYRGRLDAMRMCKRLWPTGAAGAD